MKTGDVVFIGKGFSHDPKSVVKATVSKVGRTWFTVDDRAIRFNIDTGLAHPDYHTNYQAWFSMDACIGQCWRNRVVHGIVSAIVGLDAATLRLVADLIGYEESPKPTN